jgi:hypothetical protein
MAAKRTAKGEKDQPQQAQAKSGAAAPGKQGKKDDGGDGKSESEAESVTGTLDVHYNLVSVLYHALQGAALYAEYAEDAEGEGDSELAEFFRDIQEEDRDRAERAKDYLLTRLSGSMDEDEDEEEEGASASV